MKSTELQTEFYAVLADPNDPERPFAWHLNTVEVLELEDGTKVVRNERQRSGAVCERDGITLTGVLAGLNLAAQAQLEKATARIGELEARAQAAEARAADTIATANTAISLAQNMIAQNQARIAELEQQLADKDAAAAE